MRKINQILYRKNIFQIIIILLFACFTSLYPEGKNSDKHKVETTHFTVTVLDKKTSQPLQLVNVLLEREHTI
ncbi:MAG: hypothetical protein WB779_13430, partial [Ignavibacteriaceae bacterium]